MRVIMTKPIEKIDTSVIEKDSRLRSKKTNGEKIKFIIDRQIDMLMTKTIKGRPLTNPELLTLVNCMNIMKMGFEEINASVKTKTDLKSMSTEELKEMIE